MEKIDRETYDKYFKLSCCLVQLSDYFYETRGVEIMTDYYDFCEFFFDNKDYEFFKVNKNEAKCGWIVKEDGRIISEDEILFLLTHFKVLSSTELTNAQIDQITSILKMFAIKNELLVENNEVISTFKAVKLPYNNLIITGEQIIEIRRLLKAKKHKNDYTNKEE